MWDYCTVDSRLSRHSLKSTLWGFENEWLFSLKSTLTQVDTRWAQMVFAVKSTMFHEQSVLFLRCRRTCAGVWPSDKWHCVAKVNESTKSPPGRIISRCNELSHIMLLIKNKTLHSDGKMATWDVLAFSPKSTLNQNDWLFALKSTTHLSRHFWRKRRDSHSSRLST